MFADGDVSFSASTLAVFGTVLGGVVGALITIFRLLLAAKEAQLAEIREQRDSYRKGWDRSVSLQESEKDRVLLAAGKVPIPKVAPVIAEHNSPETERQTEAAALATLLARQVATELTVQGDPARFDFPPKADVGIVVSEAIPIPGTNEVVLMIPEQTIHGVKIEPDSEHTPNGHQVAEKP